jgi:hypothetical protein
VRGVPITMGESPSRVGGDSPWINLSGRARFLDIEMSSGSISRYLGFSKNVTKPAEKIIVKMYIFVSLTVLILLGVAVLILLNTFSPPSAIITNSGDRAVQDIHLRASGGGDSYLTNVGPHQSKTVKLKISCETSLQLLYNDADKVAHNVELDTYLEPGYLGSVEIGISADNKVSFKDKTIPF